MTAKLRGQHTCKCKRKSVIVGGGYMRMAVVTAVMLMVAAANFEWGEATAAADYPFRSGCLKEKRVCTHRDEEGSPFCMRPPRHLQRPEIKLFAGNFAFTCAYLSLK